jgi:uncharacterized membrane protein YgcG
VWSSAGLAVVIISSNSTIGIRAWSSHWGVMARSVSRSVTPESSGPLRRGRSPQRRASRGGQLVIERVVEKVASAGPANYPILTKTNYNQWALLMRIKLEACGLWGTVDPGGANFQVDRMALDAICSVVPPEMITALATKETASEAWESIRMMRVGDDRIRKASAQKVRREYELLAFHDGEGVENFAMRLVGIVHQLVTLGDPEPDDKVVLKYLRIARPRYKQLVLSIETLLGVSTLSIEEVTGRLKAAEDDVVDSPAVEGKLLLTEEEWRERAKKKDMGDASCGGSNGDRGGRSRGSGNRGRCRGRGDSSGSSGGRGNNGNCHRCGKPGHWARDYRSKQPMKKEEQVYTTQEEEPSLLLAEIETTGGDGNSDEDGIAVAQEAWRVSMLRGRFKVTSACVPRPVPHSREASPARPVVKGFTLLKRRSSPRSAMRVAKIPAGGCWTPGPQIT